MTTYSRLSYTNAEEKQLIAYIEKHPALWDSSCLEYRNVQIRNHYWKVISQSLNKSVNDCRRKWRFIRDYYLHKRRSSGDKANTPNSKYFNLKFLSKVVVRRLQVKALGKKIDNADNFKDNISDDDQMETIEEHLEDMSDSSELDTLVDTPLAKTTTVEEEALPKFWAEYTEPEHTPHNETTSEEEAPIPTKSAINSNDEMLNDTVSCSETPTKVAISGQDKVINMFFASMAATVKSFPPHLVAQAKMKVFNAISELEMQLYTAADNIN